jgi:hypothetical protein
MSDTYRSAVFTPAELHRTIHEFQGRIWQLEAEVTRLREALVEERARGTYYADCYLDGRHNEPAYGLLPASDRATIREDARAALASEGLLP